MGARPDEKEYSQRHRNMLRDEIKVCVDDVL